MRFFPHDPRAERRSGVFQLTAGLIVATATVGRFLASPASWRVGRLYGMVFGSLLIAAIMICLGMLSLRDAAAYERELRLRKRFRRR